MTKSKKLLLTALSVALVAVIAVFGTIAYLTDTDSDVNVMTLGNVQIVQNEQERGDDGLQAFTQDKPAYPAVGPIEWAEEGVDVNGTKYKVFTDELKNVVDKIVTVTNTGKSDAYVRTIVAFEAPGYDENDLIHLNWNVTDITISDAVKVKINNVDYVVFAFTYNTSLAAKATSAPSLMQVFLDSEADNDYCAAFGETWDILVLSQAVQTEGFEDAATALETAFPYGENNENLISWFNALTPESGKTTGALNDPATVTVSSAAELEEALADGGSVYLTADINMPGNKRLDIPANTKALIDLNGHTFTSKDGGGSNVMAIYIYRGATLTLEDSAGGGKIVSSCYGVYVQPGATFIMNGGTINVSGNGQFDYGVTTWNSTFIMNKGTINAKYPVWATNHWKENGEPDAPVCKVTIDDDCIITNTSTIDIDIVDAPDTILDVPATLIVNK